MLRRYDAVAGGANWRTSTRVSAAGESRWWTVITSVSHVAERLNGKDTTGASTGPHKRGKIVLAVEA